VLETGTYYGSSAEFFAAVFGGPVYTVEANPRFYSYSNQRFQNHPDVHVEFGDSRRFLRHVTELPGESTETLFVYLDAHWEKDLPLGDELRILASVPRAIVMVDDFQVPGDAGYGYDNYGPGKALVEGELPTEALKGWSLSYPLVSSEQESGAKQGSCVLISPSLVDAVHVPSLRFSKIL
jgi:hypothetical protein